MKERPILFSAPMVRALLAGTKTQTRRPMRVQPSDETKVHVEHFNQTVVNRHGEEEPGPEIFGAWWHDGECGLRCPYGAPGERLWVRETCRAHELTDKEAEDDTFGVIERLGLELPPYGLDGVVYVADNSFREIENTREASDAWGAMNAYRGLRGAVVPGIHMPRWASRITLEITGVRVERLQDISDPDALAEGCSITDMRDGDRLASVYARLWESINGARSWAANPWVWVIEFRRAT